MISIRTLRVLLPRWIACLCLIVMLPLSQTALAGEGMWSGRANKFTDLVVETQGGSSHLFRVELADSPGERAEGLMYRKSMDDDAGMIFDFDRQKPVTFFMKNTYIPLDLIFIDRDGIIKTIHENAVPKSLKSIRSGVPVISVLEINGGLVATLGLSVGDLVRHSSLGNLPAQN